MLKRQRQVSPTPTFSSVPLVIADPYADFAGRDTKRRRTLPPVLDGVCRGWAHAPLFINNEEDDGEEDYISDDEIENIVPNSSINFSLTQQQPGDKAGYTSANSFLRELHTLQQHRLLFSSPPPSHSPSASTSPFLCDSNSKDTAHSYHSPPIKDHFTHGLPLQLPIERPQVSSHMSSTPSTAKLSQQQSHGFPIDEIHSVTEHYEDTNKYVISTVVF